MTSIQSQHIIQDETGTLSSDFQNDVANFSRNFQQRFGIAIQVKIFEGFVISPPEDPRIIFIGLSPRYEEWSVVFPMLLRRALSEKFITYFQTEHFAEYWENGQWVKGLADALNILGQEMTQIEKDS
ncbi:hypothetical protein [Desulfonatronovibrio magnus]|uniref:hypothetical protein n=1 Tax=Desulfonatronovibrio magnus TaxID=698827 RepID=UPI0018DCECA5|nr:hypothetical protein [Desulfonatronovibrio magnus]